MLLKKCWDSSFLQTCLCLWALKERHGTSGTRFVNSWTSAPTSRPVFLPAGSFIFLTSFTRGYLFLLRQFVTILTFPPGVRLVLIVFFTKMTQFWVHFVVYDLRNLLKVNQSTRNVEGSLKQFETSQPAELCWFKRSDLNLSVQSSSSLKELWFNLFIKVWVHWSFLFVGSSRHLLSSVRTHLRTQSHTDMTQLSRLKMCFCVASSVFFFCSRVRL